MSVLIKGMEMPKNCMSCPFPAVGVDAYYCHCPTQDGKEYDFKYADTIPDACPLVEIPTPHGRMIDADKLKRHIDKLPALPDGNFAGTHRNLKALINMQKTVIEAEGEKDGR